MTDGFKPRLPPVQSDHGTDLDRDGNSRYDISLVVLAARGGNAIMEARGSYDHGVGSLDGSGHSALAATIHGRGALSVSVQRRCAHQPPHQACGRSYFA